MRRLLAAGITALVSSCSRPRPRRTSSRTSPGSRSATNGIALGPDGNFWVAEESRGTVARMTPSGADRRSRRPVGAGTDVGGGGSGRNRVGGRHRADGCPDRHGRRRRHDPIAVRGLRPGRDRRRRRTGACTSRSPGRLRGASRRRLDRRQRHRPDSTRRAGRTESSTSPSAAGRSSPPIFDGDASGASPVGARRVRDARSPRPRRSGRDRGRRRRARRGSRCTRPVGVARFPAAQNSGRATAVPGRRRHARTQRSGSSPPRRARLRHRQAASIARVSAGRDVQVRFRPAMRSRRRSSTGPTATSTSPTRLASRVRRLVSSAAADHRRRRHGDGDDERQRLRDRRRPRQRHHGHVRVRTDDRLRRRGHRAGQRRRRPVPGRRDAHRPRRRARRTTSASGRSTRRARPRRAAT